MAEDQKLIVTLPCYNDSEYLGRAIETVENETTLYSNNFTVLIVEDKSDSSFIVKSLQRKYRNIEYFHNPEKLGRGKALREAWQKMKGDLFLYMDVDLSVDLKKMDAYANLIRGVSSGKFDIVTGSRYLEESRTYRPIIRWLVSRAYNYFVRFLFQTGINDHQCGLKSFSRRCIDNLNNIVKTDSWFWDTEILVVAKKRGYRILEIPVFWVEMRGSRTPLIRLIKDIWLHGTGLLKLLWRVYIEKSYVGRFDFNLEGNLYEEILGKSHKYYIKQKADLLLRCVKEREMDTKTVLDIGCGTGELEYVLRLETISIDLSRSMLRIAKARCGNCEFIRASCNHLPFREDVFTLVLAVNILHHLKENDRQSSFSEAHRTLIHNKHMVVFEHNSKNPFTRIVVRRCEVDKGIRLLNAKQITNLAKSHKIEKVEIKYLTFFPASFPFLDRLEREMYNIPFGGDFLFLGEKR